MRHSVRIALVLFFCILIYQQQAHAYLDPSSGSVLIQILLGGIAGFFVLLKIYWRRIRRALGMYKEVPSDEPASGETPHE